MNRALDIVSRIAAFYPQQDGEHVEEGVTKALKTFGKTLARGISAAAHRAKKEYQRDPTHTRVKKATLRAATKAYKYAHRTRVGFSAGIKGYKDSKTRRAQFVPKDSKYYGRAEKARAV